MTFDPNETDLDAQKKAEARTALIVGIVFSVVIGVMILSMLAFDIYGENKEQTQSHASQPADAAEH